MGRVLRICLLMGLLLFNGSCSRDVESSKLSITLPASGQIFQSVQAQSGGDFNTSLNPTTVSDINCYGVFVGGPTPDVDGNFCKDTSTNTEKFRFGPSTIFHPAGTTIEMDVPSGPAREIILAGVKAQNGACVTFPQNLGGEPDTSNMSVPHILARQIVDLQPGDQTVSLVASLNTSETFDDCSFFQGGGGGPNQLMFGDGRDGDITLAAGSATMSSQTLQGGISTHIQQTGGTAGTKIMSAHRRIANITNNGLTITTDTAFTGNDFEPGDEVLLHITAASDSTNFGNADSHCGSNLFIGMFDFAKVINTPNSTTIEIDRPLNNSSSFNSTGISHGSAQTDQNFCRMQIVRVPNFNKITLSGGAVTLTQSPLSLASAAGSGGIIAFRAKEVDITSNSLTIDANFLGFQGQPQGQNKTGESIHGIPASVHEFVKVGNAGQGHAQGGGGGGNAGAGAQGQSSAPSPAGPGGDAILNCLPGSSPCLPMKDKKFFFGGSGGAHDSFNGTDGGGVAIIHVGKFTGGNSFSVNADGESATGLAGGGAGGAVHLTYKESASATITVNARGGQGQNQSDQSGSGGGGSVEVSRCASQASQQPTVDVSGGTGGIAGDAGHQANADVSSICNEPI